MSDPRRLLDDPNVSASAKNLLSSLETPAPLDEPLRAAIGARVTSSVLAPATATAKVATLKAAWLVMGAVAVGGAGLATWTAFIPSPSRAAATAVGAVPRAPAPPIEYPDEPLRLVEVPTVPEPEPSSKPSPAVRATSRDTLAIEESLLEQARRSVGSPARALSLLREHERRFPNGELTAERLYLMAETHARAGNLPAARRTANALAARFPRSTYLPRLRALFSQESE